MKIEEIVKILSSSLGSRKNTFSINKGYIDCELGGTFTPSCGEMLIFSAREFKNPNGKSCLINNVYDVVRLKNNQSFVYSNASTRLFYEVLKRDTNFDFIETQIRATGIVECSLIVQTGTQNRIVQRNVLDFGPEVKTLALPIIDLISLPENGSLILNVRGLSDNCYVYGFRWIGKVAGTLANMGERIVLLRTFGHKAAIINRLKSFEEALDHKQAAILKRTLFIVYDAADDSSRSAIEEQTENLRLIILRGPNFGGGGNASLLVSLILRAGEMAGDAISEILIMDDDARFDAETLIRHDSFITARKENIISTGIIYSASSPTTIQLSGGFWGKFCSNANRGPEITNKTDVRLYFPYVIRKSEDVSHEDICKYIASYQEIEFSAFIFISFPYKFLKECGAPLPFFLRNDDVEICLRCMEYGGKIVINANLQLWHETANSPISEFYTILHALIINCYHGGLDKSYFYITFMERVSRIAKVGNYVLLRAYELALRMFAQCSGWMEPQTIFCAYNEASSQLKQIFSDLYSSIPTEVARAKIDESNIISLVDFLPDAPVQKTTIFIDNDACASYTIDQQIIQNDITESLVGCINNLHKISLAFDDIQERWKNFVKNFNHISFWNEALAEPVLAVEFQRPMANENMRIKKNQLVTVFQSDVMEEAKRASFEKLPKGFTREGYLACNPDVKKSGIDPVQHWLRYGQFEGRKF